MILGRRIYPGDKRALPNMDEADFFIALAGNPNTGKSTVFNRLTGLKQHTGNWPGKTVATALGKYDYEGKNYTVIDLPGTYSLRAKSAEEEVARDFILYGRAHVIVIVVDATCLERNLNLVLQILEMTRKVIVCVNLLDEAGRKEINVDLKKLEVSLQVPIVGTSARSGRGLDMLKEEIYRQVTELKPAPSPVTPLDQVPSSKSLDQEATCRILRAEQIANQVVSYGKKDYDKVDRRIDRILTSHYFGIPIMLFLLALVFWITIKGANYPSEMLFKILFQIEDLLSEYMWAHGWPPFWHGFLVLGIYRTLAWVVAVMLPPMAIFFPLFTLLEDLGVLPRIAFNLDNFFEKAATHGKQALTMCMGLGCNAAGVVACRIIESPRERIIATLTNNFVPCNGRFPLLITLASVFFVSGNGKNGIWASLFMLAIIVLSVLITLFTSKLLSKTLLKGIPSSFALELPPYRLPQIGQVLIRSLLDRTLSVLGRAVIVAIPAGAVVWLLANTNSGGSSMLEHIALALDPAARWFGLDGHILFAFILGLPANEIVLPLILMSYARAGALLDITNLTELHRFLLQNGWTWVTALCTVLFSLNHWPCGTTLLTILGETRSKKWTFLSFVLPTAAGLMICFIVTQIASLLAFI